MRPPSYRRARKQRYVMPRIRVPYWGVVRTPVGKEKWAKENIIKQGGRTFIPRILKDRSGQLMPLFPGYVFVWIDGPWSYLRSTYGVIELVLDRGRPARVRKDEIEQMIAAQGDEGFIDLSPPLFEPSEGDTVKIATGLFKDHVAVYAGLLPENRIRAILDFLGQPQELILRRRDILPPDS